MSGEMTSLLLVGRSGHGKSSIGNSILGEKVFEPKFNVTEDSHQSDDVIAQPGKVNDREFKVVDATGLADNDEEFPENADHFIDLANKAMKLVPRTGYSAILLVLRYGIRFTKQETLTVKLIKSLFGPEVIQRHGIIVMTCGDQFKRDMEDEGASFQQWCGQQEGEVKQLMKECGQRCVLFDNKTKDPGRQRQQVQQLLDKVEQIKGQAGPYTESSFHSAEPGRNKLRALTKVPQLQQELKDINPELEKVKGHDQDLQEKELEDLQVKIRQIETVLQGMDKNVDSVSSLSSELNSIKMTVDLQYQLLKTKGVIQKQPGRSDKPKEIHSPDHRAQVSDARCRPFCGDCGSQLWQMCRRAFTSLPDLCCKRCSRQDNDGRNNPV